MKTHRLSLSLAAALVVGLAQNPVHAEGAQPTHTSMSPEELTQRNIERRAVDAFVWGMPAVNFQLMLDAFVGLGGGPNQVIFWSRPLNWKNQTLTPNPDTIYFTPFYDTRNGPVVLEIPPAGEGNITGSIDDGWQNPLEDVGPAGLDKGKGGKYLILPPGFKGTVPQGYFPLHSATYQGYAILRSNLKSGSDADIASAVAYGKRIKFYPLPSSGAVPGDTHFVDAYDKPYDSTIPYDSRFFDALNRFVQVEPWIERDKAMIDPLKSLGIEKGKAGDALAANKATFDKAGPEAKALIELWTEHAFVPPFNEGTHWALPVPATFPGDMASNFADPNRYPIDARAVGYALAYFSAKHLGAGQFYLVTIKDNAGNLLSGASTYRLHVPANPPVKLYWSVTAYDHDTHALIKDVRWASRGSNTPGLVKNADGSVDIYFSPSAPAGKESNWVPTDAHGKFELLFRLYGPEKPFFDKVWKLPDLELQR
ncbi:DUF1254 domain-containing protein [Dyella sp. C11]|uniref:DUF1254 domain-containing protein n=1 Tax=Dyella sp. C11 TaxID=2126991 RepID=UPI0018E55B29|nr:DUF1254 domain-containing protein [Dyella sp. C11]